MAGRKKGGSNRGYTYRKDTGYWIVTKSRRPLLDEQCHKIRDQRTPIKVLDVQYRRHLDEERKLQQERGLIGNETTVAVICDTYLQHCKIHDSEATFKMRQEFLWDFCTGLPPATIESDLSKVERERLRIHGGYGKVRIGELRPDDVTQWLDAHGDWNGARRNAIQAVKRAMNYCCEQGLISESPIETERRSIRQDNQYLVTGFRRVRGADCLWGLPMANSAGAVFNRLVARPVGSEWDPRRETGGWRNRGSVSLVVGN